MGGIVADRTRQEQALTSLGGIGAWRRLAWRGAAGWSILPSKPTRLFFTQFTARQDNMGSPGQPQLAPSNRFSERVDRDFASGPKRSQYRCYRIEATLAGRAG